MFTIGQFAKICNISPKALRHYEKIGLLLPAKVDRFNQYRYYAREQIDQAKTITFFKDLGVPLKTIRLIVGGQPKEDLTRILAEHRNMLVETINACTTKIFRLDHWEQHKEEKNVVKKDYSVHLQTIPQLSGRALRQVSTNFPADIGPAFETILREMQEKKIIPTGAPMIVYYDEEFNPQKVDFEVAWPVDDQAFANMVYSGGLAAVCTHVGPYDQLCSAYEAAFTWINENGYKVAGPLREIYPNDPSVTPPEELVTQVIIPVQKI